MHFVNVALDLISTPHRFCLNSATPYLIDSHKLALAPRILAHTSVSGLRTPSGLWALSRTLSCTLSSIPSPFQATPVNP